MTVLLIVIHVVVCLVLILVILLQAGRGQGLSSSSFGSGNVQSLFGTKAADFLTKATAVAAIGFLFTCIALDLIEARRNRSLFEKPAESQVDMNQIRKALEKVKAESANAPASPAAEALPADAAQQASAAPAAAPEQPPTAAENAQPKP